MKLSPEKLDIVKSPKDRLDFLRQEEQRIAEEIRAHKAEVRNRNIAAECGQTIPVAEIQHWKQRHKALADALQAVFCETGILNKQILR
jgi:hypothetical protein